MNFLFLDTDLVVVNKPAGLLSIQDGYQPQLPNLKSHLESVLGRVYTVHRLDKETSGAIVYARNIQTHKALNLQFEKHQVQKTYIAHVFGFPISDAIVIDLPLKIDGDRRHRTVPDQINGKPAETKILVLSRLQSGSLLTVQPLTGYTHQIRAHLSAIDHPILGDTLYGTRIIPKSEIESQGRLQLHAHKIQFLHPALGTTLEIIAPFTEDLPAFFEYFKQTNRDA